MKIDKDLYTSHIKNDDKRFEMRRLLDKIELALKNHSIESTDFMDPYERYLARSIINRFDDIKYKEFGGTSSSERKVIFIYPDYLDDNYLDLNLTYLRVKGVVDGLNHRDYLGSLLSLGIKRSKTGDILVHKDYTDIILKNEIGNFVLQNLDKVGGN